MIHFKCNKHMGVELVIMRNIVKHMKNVHLLEWRGKPMKHEKKNDIANKRQMQWVYILKQVYTSCYEHQIIGPSQLRIHLESSWLFHSTKGATERFKPQRGIALATNVPMKENWS
jgi:hypothetical protein